MKSLVFVMSHCAIGLIVLAGTASAATVLIDDFSTPQQLVVIGAGSTSGSASGGGILGGERDTEATVTTGLGMSLDINQLGFQLLAFSQNAITDGSAKITWDGSDGSGLINPTGLGGVDLTGGTGTGSFLLSGLTDDLPVDVTLTAYTDAANFSSHTLNLPGGIFLPTDLSIAYADFSVAGGSGADFTNIGALQMAFDGVGIAAVDVSLESIRAVPEPSTMWLLAGLGVMGAVRFRRRR